jgi:hypothetical protein
MEFVIQHGTNKHFVTVATLPNKDGLHIDVTRVRLIGGTPLTVRLDVEPTITFDACLTKINNLAKLDCSIFKLLASHTNGEPDEPLVRDWDV